VVHLAYGGHFLQNASVTSRKYCPWAAVYGCKSQGYGSFPILYSVFYLSLNPSEAPGRQVIATDADVKQVITSWLQKLDNSVFTL